MEKQPVILESVEKTMGKDWQLWKAGINEAVSNKQVKDRLFNDPIDQRAYNWFRTHLCNQFPNIDKPSNVRCEQLSLF